MPPHGSSNSQIGRAFSFFLLGDWKSACFRLDIPAYKYACALECIQSVESIRLDSTTGIYFQGQSLSCNELLPI